ncbi:MAG: hypothetical protein ACKOBT_04555 [Actinomycetota bacterium]
MISGSVLTSAAQLARERVLPVHPALGALFGSDVAGATSGLVRGQTVACVGTAAMSCALALAATATQTGSWAGVVGVPQVGVVAAQHLGVVLERTVFIALPTTTTSGERPDLVGALSALVDGVDLVIMARRTIAALSPSVMRRLQARVQSRGAVLVIIGDPGTTSVDLRVSARAQYWQGIGTGHGHLRRRLVALELDGRRCGRPRRHSVWLPGDDGGLSTAGETSSETASETSVVVPLRRTG